MTHPPVPPPPGPWSGAVRPPVPPPPRPSAPPASLAPPPPAGLSVLPPVRQQHGAGTLVALVVLGVLALVALAAVGLQIGLDALPLAAALALVPLAGVLLAIRWVDRWEPEPWQALAVAFGWGASVAVLVSLVLNTGAQLLLVATGVPELEASAWAATVVAPVVEETVKALGVLLVFLAWRRSFDGPVDGLVYAATVAAGFAFVENILYFGTTMVESEEVAGAGSALVTVFLMRGVMSPFAHVLFTACTGLALGIAAERRSRGAWVVAFPVGLLGSVGLHALWNGSATMGDGTTFLTMYVVLQVPLFLGVVGLVVWLRRREAAVLRRRLGEYAAAWWFAPAEVHMLASLGERRRAAAWAATRGGPAARGAMRDFQRAATRLAYLRHRADRQGGDPRVRQDEGAALGAVVVARQRLARALAV